MELLTVDTVFEARAKLLELARPLFVRTEALKTPYALGRILAADILAPEDIPAFMRSTVDGYAVRSDDTIGAGESIPAVLVHRGAVEMGRASDDSSHLAEEIKPGECVYIPTGGMLPPGTDAVVMIEQTESFGSKQIGIYTPVYKGENVVYPGDDIAAGTKVCEAGTQIGAAEIGIAAALGVEFLEVFTEPVVRIISTGDELVEPNRTPLPGEVRDINSWALSAQAQKAGFSVTAAKIVPDDEEALIASLEEAMFCSDIVVISGGSSQGEKDATARVIETVASLGVLTQGLALKPGKPTITGFDEPSRTLIIGLPGHPASAMMVFEITLCWLKRELQKTPHPFPLPASLARNIPGAAGKDTLQLVRLTWEEEQGSENVVSVGAPALAGRLVATPVHTKSGLISRLSEATGYVWIDRNVEGITAGASVAVYLL